MYQKLLPPPFALAVAPPAAIAALVLGARKEEADMYVESQ